MTATAHNVETAAAEAIEILKQWKNVRDEYMAAKHGDEASWLRSLGLGEEMDGLYSKAMKVMTEDVFADVTEYDVMGWMYDEYDGLMADLADITRGEC